MATPYFRAIATCSVLKTQLQDEIQSRQAMELCFQKIHSSLDNYKGHLVNRIRFHLNRHHTEYLRKIKSADIRKSTPTKKTKKNSKLNIEQVTAELKQAKDLLAQKEQQIEELSRMLDQFDCVLPTANDAGTQAVEHEIVAEGFFH
jgi:hypothetical protein